MVRCPISHIPSLVYFYWPIIPCTTTAAQHGSFKLGARFLFQRAPTSPWDILTPLLMNCISPRVLTSSLPWPYDCSPCLLPQDFFSQNGCFALPSISASLRFMFPIYHIALHLPDKPTSTSQYNTHCLNQELPHSSPCGLTSTNANCYLIKHPLIKTTSFDCTLPELS